MFKILFRTFLAFNIIGLCIWFYFKGCPNQCTLTNIEKIYYFPNLQGPKDITVIPPPQPTSYKLYSQGTDSRLAVLLTDSDSAWLSLVHGLKSMGIPFLMTTNYQTALRHKAVLIYPSTDRLSIDAQNALASYPFQGGTLIAQNVVSPSLFKTFGFQSIDKVSKSIAQLQFHNYFIPTMNLTLNEQKTINIGDGNKLSAARYAYINPEEVPLALYENNKAAIIQKTYAKGRAYAFGIDLGQLMLIGYNRRQYSSEEHHIAKYYVNQYTPYLDVLLQCIKNMYLQAQPNGVIIGNVPNGKSLAVIITHDIDYSGSMPNSLDYLKIELKHGVKATYFVQTKYITDANDYAFFTANNLITLKKLIDAGMEVTSEAVSHSLQFNVFPLGTGKEQYPTYHPYVAATYETYTHTVLKAISATKTYNGSILGELRVSRFLLHHFFPQLRLISFRPGYLKNPYQLPQALAATGFHYSSSVTSGDSLTHLPFQLFYNRDVDVGYQSNVPVYEFPITLEDQEAPYSLLERLPKALELAKKISTYGGLYVILIHPNITGQKLDFLDKFLNQIPHLVTTWFGTLGEFGDWWFARDQIGIDVFNKGKIETVQITAPLPISGLTLLIPDNFNYLSSIPEKLKVEQNGNKFLIKQKISGKIKLKFETQY